VFDIQARGSKKHEAPGICPVCPMFNPVLAKGTQFLHLSCQREALPLPPRQLRHWQCLSP